MERLTTALFLLSLLAYPISMMRVPSIGFNKVHILQTLLAIVVALTFIFRKRMSDIALVAVPVVVFTLLSIGGLLQYGIMSGGYLFATAAVFVLSTTIGVRSAIVFGILFLFCTGVTAWLYTAGLLSLPVPAAEYFLLPSVWGTVGVSFLLPAGVFIIAISGYISNTQQLVGTIIRQNRQIRHLANHDALTGLPTLRLAMDRVDMAINQCKRTPHKLALLYLDLDGFKGVNDAHGHEAGNQVLQAVSRRMLRVVRDGDTVCRIGGDEFLILLSRIRGRQDAEGVCERLLQKVHQDICCEGRTIRVGVSIGVALFPDHAQDGRALRHAADQAMYEAKRRGRNRYHVTDGSGAR